MNRTFDVPGPLALEVKVPAGEIAVTTHDAATAELELLPLKANEASERMAEEVRVELRQRGDGYQLVVDAEEGRFGFLSWGSAELRVVAHVPHGTDLEVSSRSADVAGAGTLGSVAVKTASGEVELPVVEGDAAVKSASGDVTVHRVGGAFVANTASGDVEVGEIGGNAVVKSASGDVQLGPVGAGANVATASGDVRIASVAGGEVTIQSASGDVEVGIKRGSRLWVDAKSMSGETRSELELGDAPLDGDEGPLVELRATTMSGDVLVRRAAE